MAGRVKLVVLSVIILAAGGYTAATWGRKPPLEKCLGSWQCEGDEARCETYEDSDRCMVRCEVVRGGTIHCPGELTCQTLTWKVQGMRLPLQYCMP
jgi:hypothetical protein